MGSRRLTRARRTTLREWAEREALERRKERRSADIGKEKTEAAIHRRNHLHDIPTREDIEDAFDGKYRYGDIDVPRRVGRLVDILFYSPERSFRDKFRSLLLALIEKAPRIIEGSHYSILSTLCMQPWVREIGDWKVRGKSQRRQLRSLVDHFLVLYPVPRFLYDAFGSSHSRCSVGFFAAVARGVRVAKCFNGNHYTIPMTTRMCHYLMNSSGDEGFFPAVREAQLKALGGSGELARALSAGTLWRREMIDEDFWLTVLRWFCRQDDVDLSLAGPVIDYIEHRRSEDESFSMKGRTFRTLCRSMEGWHRELAVERELVGIKFTPSGIEGGIWEEESRHGGRKVKFIWTIDEILTSRQLFREGKSMRHCVYVYADKVAESKSSIWSLRFQDERRLTVEVLNDTSLVVQARGKYNRPPEKREMRMISRWAKENRLVVKI